MKNNKIHLFSLTEEEHRELVNQLTYVFWLYRGMEKEKQRAIRIRNLISKQGQRFKLSNRQTEVVLAMLEGRISCVEGCYNIALPEGTDFSGVRRTERFLSKMIDMFENGIGLWRQV